jgi:predicted Rossmann fold nucleotide-binding protein DprA/Smf involved in DNA uptake
MNLFGRHKEEKKYSITEKGRTVSDKLTKGMKPEDKILLCLAEKESADINDIANETGLSVKDAAKWLVRMKQNGSITEQGK